MRYLFMISVALLLTISACSPSAMEMKNEVLELTAKVDSLSSKIDALTKQNKMQEDEISWIESEMAELDKLKHPKAEVPQAMSKPIASPAKAAVRAPEQKVADKPVKDTQCQAITNSGKRCSRPALEGSKYCQQHKEIYEPDIPGKK